LADNEREAEIDERPMCKNCRFWGVNMAPDYYDDLGSNKCECVRFPPDHFILDMQANDVFSNYNWHHPITLSKQCCGEFKPC